MGESGGPSSAGLLIGAGVVAFVAALGGALLALAIDDPEVVVTERVVEVSSTDPPIELARPDVANLASRLETLGGFQSEWSEALVDELAGVCSETEAPAPDDDTTAWLARELADLGGVEIPQTELEAFVDEVRAACPG